MGTTTTLTIKVAISNIGGTLDHRILKFRDETDHGEITKAVLGMIKDAGRLLPGDTITVREID